MQVYPGNLVTTENLFKQEVIYLWGKTPFVKYRKKKKNLSRRMTKPTKWPVRTVTQADLSLHCALNG